MTLSNFIEKYPESYDGCLDCISYAITCSFNRKGTLLAVGCNDGRIVLWDFTTRCISKILQAHTHPVCTLSWSRNGYKIASGSTDNNVSIWDILTGDCVNRFRFPTLISKVQFNPRNNNQLLVCLIKHPAILLDLKNGRHIALPLDEEAQQDTNIIASFDRRGDHIYTGNSKGKILIFNSIVHKVEDEVNAEKFHYPATLELVASFKMGSIGGSITGVAIKDIEFAKRGENFLVCTADRVIRIFNADIALACKVNPSQERDTVELEPIQKLCDLVNRTQWKKCCFSGGRNSLPNLSISNGNNQTLSTSTYVCAGSAKQHSIYIWELSTSTLVKILHGTKGEILLDLAWHPTRGIIASVSGGGAGSVTLWSHPRVENWSAFAPDFKELDDNVEYVERESEFDLSDQDKDIEHELKYFTAKKMNGVKKYKRKDKKLKTDKESRKLYFLEDDSEMQNETNESEGDLSEIELIDVITVENTPVFLSSDEETLNYVEDSLLYLPMAPEIDDPENPIQPSILELDSSTSTTINPHAKNENVKSTNDVAAPKTNDVDSSANIYKTQKSIQATQTNQVTSYKTQMAAKSITQPPTILDIKPIVQTLKKAQEVITSLKFSTSYTFNAIISNKTAAAASVHSSSNVYKQGQMAIGIVPGISHQNENVRLTINDPSPLNVNASLPVATENSGNLTSAQILQSEIQKQILAKMVKASRSEHPRPESDITMAPPALPPALSNVPTSLILPPTLKFKTSNPIQILVPNSFVNSSAQQQPQLSINPMPQPKSTALPNILLPGSKQKPFVTAVSNNSIDKTKN